MTNLRVGLFFALLGALVACGGGGGGSPATATSPPLAQPPPAQPPPAQPPPAQPPPAQPPPAQPPPAQPPPAQPPPPPGSLPPTASTGPDQSVRGGEVVTLTGSGTDPEGGALTYSWAQTSGPKAALENASSPVAQFSAFFMEGMASLGFELTVTDPDGMTAAGSTNVLISSDFVVCSVVTPPPPQLGLAPFYRKYCVVDGIPVSTSSLVADRALEWVGNQARWMLSMRPDLMQAIRDFGRVSIMADTEVLTEIPEYSNLNQLFPGGSSDGRAWDSLRGFGVGLTAVGEEFVLCDGESSGGWIFVHEFAHQVATRALGLLDPTWYTRVSNAFETSIASGLWSGTYSATNWQEWWADGVNIFYGYPFFGVGNRDELAAYDAALYQMIIEVFPPIDIPMCPIYPVD